MLYTFSQVVLLCEVFLKTVGKVPKTGQFMIG